MIFALFSILTMVIVGWVANDAARRHRSWFGWAFLVANTSVLGLILWLRVRKRSPATEAQPGALRRALLWLAVVPVAAVSSLLAAFIVTFLFQLARVEGHAMEPTLNDHDRAVVNKLVYWIGAPQPGDVVMLRYPLDPQKSFVKRVIAVEGDRVRLVDGRVFVNDVALRDDYVPADFRSHDDWGPIVVRQGYFVMGDRRNNSSDSRHWGLVPRKYILGRVWVHWRPFSAAAGL